MEQKSPKLCEDPGGLHMLNMFSQDLYHDLLGVVPFPRFREASGGVHGDNRLAGNSLLECLLAEGWGV